MNNQPQKSAITAAAEKKAHLKKNLSELVEMTQDASSSFNIGLQALRNNNAELAVKKFLHVLEVDKSEDMEKQVRPNLGQAYLQQGDTVRAIFEFRQALRLNQPSDVKAFIYANMGYIYTQKNFYGFALKTYRQAIKENPKDVTSLLTLGMLYENKFRYDDAKETFNHILKLDPNNNYAKESLERIAAATPVAPKQEVVRLIKMLPTLGLIVVMSYDVTYEDYFPMVIYVYPESPLRGQVELGDKILNVLKTSSEDVAEDDPRRLDELLECMPNGMISMLVGENVIEARAGNPIQRQMEPSEREQVYRDWLLTFDSRLAWLWSAPQAAVEDVGLIWGNELASLVRELGPLKHTYVYDLAYALMIEHQQAFSLTETDPETREVKELRIETQINLSRFPYAQAFPDLIQNFNELQFAYVAQLLAARI